MDIFNRPPAISEDTLHYILHPSTNPDRPSVLALATVIREFVDTLLPNHLWHRDGFQLMVNLDEDEKQYVIEGRMRVGDCVDDEWCAVWLLREISSKWDVVVRFVHLRRDLSFMSKHTTNLSCLVCLIRTENSCWLKLRSTSRRGWHPQMQKIGSVFSLSLEVQTYCINRSGSTTITYIWFPLHTYPHHLPSLAVLGM